MWASTWSAYASAAAFRGQRNRKRFTPTACNLELSYEPAVFAQAPLRPLRGGHLDPERDRHLRALSGENRSPGEWGCEILGDERWLESCRYRYEYYVEQSLKQGRVPRPFEPFAAGQLFEQFVTTWRFIQVVKDLRLEWETPPAECELPRVGGHCGPKDLARYVTVVRDHIERAFQVLHDQNLEGYRLVMEYCRRNRWAYARFGLSAEEGQATVEEAKMVLLRALTRGAVTA